MRLMKRLAGGSTTRRRQGADGAAERRVEVYRDHPRSAHRGVNGARRGGGEALRMALI